MLHIWQSQQSLCLLRDDNSWRPLLKLITISLHAERLLWPAIYIIKERLKTLSSMESYLPTSDRHAASWIFSDGPRQPVGVVKLRYNALNLFFDNVAI